MLGIRDSLNDRKKRNVCNVNIIPKHNKSDDTKGIKASRETLLPIINKMEESLKKDTIKGVGWSAVDNVLKFAVTFVVSILLARLLSPDDYGLIGITAIFTTICKALTDGGFVSALIRKNDVTDDDYNTAFIANFSISVLLYITIFIGSSSISRFFGRHELISLIRVASFGIVLGAVAFVPRARLTKAIDFKTQAVVTSIASLSSGIIGVVLAFAGAGVWALVSQGLFNQFADSFGLWYYCKWKPSFTFSSKSFHNLFGFGWKMMLSQLINTTWSEIFQGVIAKFYNPATLGQYTRAGQFSSLFSSNLTKVIQRVTYPVLSKIQSDKSQMVSVYRNMIKITMFITAISMLFLAGISEPLLYCLIGSKWSEAAKYLPILCLTGSLYPLHAFNLNMLQVEGRSDLFLLREIIEKIIDIIPIFIGIYIGIMPMLYAGLFTNIIDYFINSYYSGKSIGYSSWKQIQDVLPHYCIASIVFLSIYFLKFIPLSYWIILPLQSIVGTIVIIVICKALKMKEYIILYELTKSYIHK